MANMDDYGVLACSNCDYWNTSIHHNLIYDNLGEGTWKGGIYPDSASSNLILHHNIVWNTGSRALFLNAPSEFNHVYNSTFIGGKENYLDVMPYGVDGYLSAFMLFMPQIAHDFWNAACAGDIKKAVHIIETCERPFFDDLCKSADADFDALIHGAMEIAGITKRWRRKPYHSLSDEQMEKVKEFMNNIRLN